MIATSRVFVGLDANRVPRAVSAIGVTSSGVMLEKSTNCAW